MPGERRRECMRQRRAESLERAERRDQELPRLVPQLADVERRGPRRGRRVDVPQVERSAADQEYGRDHDNRPAHAFSHGASGYSDPEVAIIRKVCLLD